MSEDNTEGTEQMVPAAQKVPETTLSVTVCINPEILEYTRKEQHKQSDFLRDKMEYIKQTLSEKERIVLWNLPGKEREFRFSR